MTNINIGATPNDGNGDTLRGAFNIVNDNFAEVEGFLVSQVTQTQLDAELANYATITYVDDQVNDLTNNIITLNSRLENDELDIAALQTETANLTIALGNKANTSQLNAQISAVNASIASTNDALALKVGEAPVDDKEYVRKNESWVELKPYRVYTALLSQSGGDNPTYLSSGDLIVGASYRIEDNGGSGFDFTGVGAANNNIGTWFIAKNTTPIWGTDGSLYYNSGAPVVNVLENTLVGFNPLAKIYWTYANPGQYNANLVGAFIDTKTFVMLGNPNSAFTSTPGVCDSSVDIDFVQINTFDKGFQPIDNQLFLNPIEIRVYN
jgi:hypothetical protein